MSVKNIFDQAVADEIVSRVNALQSTNGALWGKMSVSQMLAHMSAALDTITADAPPPRMLSGRFFGWILKKKLTDESRMSRNLPTVPSFFIKEDKDLEKERSALLVQLELLRKKGQSGVHNIVHPFFGKLTGEEWGLGTWKHFDHHLRQFGV